MLHSFTRNHSDLSTEAGFQFEFYCDCCQNGYKSTFCPSSTYGQKKRSEAVGRGAGVLGSLLGGRMSDIGWAVERGSGVLRDRMEDRSPQWRREQEAAFDEAQREARRHFSKCPGCNSWVCSDCWNEEEGLCITCAPRESGYVAKARSRAMRRNIDEKADSATVWKGSITTRTTICPQCGQPAGSGNFCSHCGATLTRNQCPNCGADVALGLKFCGECGARMEGGAPCPACGSQNPPGTRFCGECGSKLQS